MKVLIVSEYNDGNSIIKSYIDGIKRYAEVESGISIFWDSKIKYDIVHIQWPEQLFNWRRLEKSDLQKLKVRLAHWKNQGAKIVLTRHNSKSHRNYPLDDNLYNIVLENADGIVHLYEYEFGEFQSNSLYSSKVNVVINHPNYFNIPINTTKEIARKKFKINKDAIVYLTFGTMRDPKEEKDLLSAFNRIKIKNKRLIIARSVLFKNRISFKQFPVKRLTYEIKKYFLRRDGVNVNEDKHINESEIADYFMSADILVIPRIHQLNSGQIYLAFTFSKIVVGPDIGNIGLILEKTGNFLYKPGDIDSYSLALQKASACIHSSIGAANYRYVALDCDIYKIGREHYQLYNLVLNN